MKVCPNSECPMFGMFEEEEYGHCGNCGKYLVKAPKCQCGCEFSKTTPFCKGCGRPTK